MLLDRRRSFALLTAAIAGTFVFEALACNSGSDGTTATANVLTASVSADKGPVTACMPDESAPVTARCSPTGAGGLPTCGVWTKVEPAGIVCGDGSPYKFFVNYSNTSNNVAVEFEPGGACWDYESCTGANGERGAANPNGIPDDHMTTYQFLNLLRRTEDNPAKDYNLVFASYCTGDIHTGNQDAMYTSTDGTKTLSYHHHGHANSAAIATWVQQNFPVLPKLFMTGCSAGGAGALLNYPFMRKTISQAQCGYLLDDSGPIFHSDGPSKPLDAKIRQAWNLDSVFSDFAGAVPIAVSDLESDYGMINSAIAEGFPKDRLALTAYQRDLNYSLYSYDGFYPNLTEADVHAYWITDFSGLLPTLDAQPNFAYYLPYFRTDNCSHCVSIPPIGNAPLEPTDTNKALTQPWLGSEIPEDMVDLKAFTTTLLDDTQPMKSYVQEVVTSEVFSPAESAQCFAD